jgi:hypothetical protein
MNTQLKSAVETAFGDMGTEIVKFINWIRFAPKGLEEIEKLIREALDHSKPGHDILGCLKKYEECWIGQTEEVRGDPTAPGTVGEDSRQALWYGYHILRLPVPSYLNFRGS